MVTTAAAAYEGKEILHCGEANGDSGWEGGGAEVPGPEPIRLLWSTISRAGRGRRSERGRSSWHRPASPPHAG